MMNKEFDREQCRLITNQRIGDFLLLIEITELVRMKGKSAKNTRKLRA